MKFLFKFVGLENPVWVNGRNVIHEDKKEVDKYLEAFADSPRENSKAAKKHHPVEEKKE